MLSGTKWDKSQTAQTNSSVTRKAYWFFFFIIHTVPSFIKWSYPSPYEWITHDQFMIHFTNSMVNFNCWHILCIQKAENHKLQTGIFWTHFVCCLNFHLVIKIKKYFYKIIKRKGQREMRRVQFLSQKLDCGDI